MISRLIAFIVVAFFVGPGCALARGVPGSGRIVDQAFIVPPFHGVAVCCGLDADVHPGPAVTARLIGDDNLVALVRIRVEDGILHTAIPDGISLDPTRKITLVATSPVIDEIDASGGATVKAQPTACARIRVAASGGAEAHLRGVQSDQVEAEASGGATVELAGSARELETDASGGATVKAYDFAVQVLELDLSGGAEGYFQAMERVTGSVSGGSEVHFRGHPRQHQIDASGGAEVAYDP